jgi:hypothetical protein
VSYGGGVQSTALLVLAAQGKIDYRTFLFANTGDDSEHPSTLAYVREVAVPYAERHGIGLHILDRHRRDGSVETLWGRLMKPESRSLPIPVRMSNGAPGHRQCTADFKIRVTGKWVKQHGASKDDPATMAIGISVDEIHRANNRRSEAYENIVYPLLDLRLRRTDCARIIAEVGLPVPPKSACFFCPFHRPSAWADMARDEPALFDLACQLEDTLNDRRDMLGKDHVYLTRFGMPLRDATCAGQDLLPLLDDTSGICDEGRCWL